MSKHFRILLFAMLAIALMAGSAFAGPVQVNHAAANGEVTVSSETLGQQRDIRITALGGGAGGNALTPAIIDDVALGYVPGQAVTVGSLVNVTFGTGGAFNGAAVIVCAQNGASPIHITTATPAANITTYNFSAGNAVGSGGLVYFASSATCNAAGSNTLNTTRVLANSSGSILVNVALLSSGGISLDPAGSANFARVRAEYASNTAAANHTVDYLGTPGNGTRLIPGTVLYAASNGGNVNGAINVGRNANIYNVNGAAGDNAGLTARMVVGLTDAANWQGIAKVFLVNGNDPTTCTDNAATNLVGTGTLNGTLSFNIPAGAFNGQVGMSLSACAIAGGNTLNIPRNIQASVDINVTGTGAADPGASAYANIDTWDTNAFQGLATWLVNSSSLPTYCLLTNNDQTRTATVLMDLLSSEGATVMGTQTLGTLAPRTAVLATFTGNSVSLAGGTAVDLTSLGTDKRYLAKITSTVTPNNATLTCIQTDPVTGSKRSVPVLHNNALIQ